MTRSILLLSFAICLSAVISAQGICNPSGNILIYSNYDGGNITINIDENIPDIRIGLCSYEELHVTITGAYAANITQVLYAGYNDGGVTSVDGVDPGIVDILTYPPVYLYDPDGNDYMVCAYECDTNYVPGGCNTVDQATDYFLTELPGTLRYSYYQYGIWSGTYDMTDGGNCCYDADCFIALDAGQDVSICEGETASLNVVGGSEYSWYDDAGTVACTPPCDDISVSPDVTTTYQVVGTDDEGCSGNDSVTVFVYPFPEADITFVDGDLVAAGGVSYQWYYEGEIIDGATSSTYTPTQDGIYTVMVTNEAGCEDMSDEFAVVVKVIDFVSAHLISVYPNPANDILIIESQLHDPAQLLLTTLTGEVIAEQSQAITVAESYLHTASVPAGVYLLKITCGSVVVTKQVVISH